jgi:hypothetical protein
MRAGLANTSRVLARGLNETVKTGEKTNRRSPYPLPQIIDEVRP